MSCPDNYAGHNFQPPDPPEWMNTHEWTDDEWRAWYDDQTDYYCAYCGESDG